MNPQAGMVAMYLLHFFIARRNGELPEAMFALLPTVLLHYLIKGLSPGLKANLFASNFGDSSFLIW